MAQGVVSFIVYPWVGAYETCSGSGSESGSGSGSDSESGSGMMVEEMAIVVMTIKVILQRDKSMKVIIW